ncbi:hypothetical protein EYF80_060808 [Liparis tanakae]|uniref:Uncharacterized protein n=1 Tax=Liparis tanakae TaxID=230148 RepID=A0A4Z2EKQ5_9TELE|nr:hypothetical protein EYF80_060808 [Liparis tanakae]
MSASFWPSLQVSMMSSREPSSWSTVSLWRMMSMLKARCTCIWATVTSGSRLRAPRDASLRSVSRTQASSASTASSYWRGRSQGQRWKRPGLLERQALVGVCDQAVQALAGPPRHQVQQGVAHLVHRVQHQALLRRHLLQLLERGNEGTRDEFHEERERDFKGDSVYRVMFFTFALKRQKAGVASGSTLLSSASTPSSHWLRSSWALAKRVASCSACSRVRSALLLHAVISA